MESGELLKISGNTMEILAVDVRLNGKGKQLGCGEVVLVGQRFLFCFQN
jgi:hypothetical protein